MRRRSRLLQRSNSFESEEEQKEEKATREKILEEERRDTTWKKESEETDVVRDVEDINEGPIKEDVARLVSRQKTPQTPLYCRTCLILDN